MLNIKFEHQREQTDENLKSYAATIGLNTEAFNSWFTSKKFEKVINQDLQDGWEIRIRAHPDSLSN